MDSLPKSHDVAKKCELKLVELSVNIQYTSMQNNSRHFYDCLINNNVPCKKLNANLSGLEQEFAYSFCSFYNAAKQVG